MFGKAGIIAGTGMLTPGTQADGQRLRGQVLAGLTIAGNIGMGDTSSMRGVGARLYGHRSIRPASKIVSVNTAITRHNQSGFGWLRSEAVGSYAPFACDNPVELGGLTVDVAGVKQH